MIAIVLGTRPEIIKMSPIIRECERKHSDYFILHTGQHYSYTMDQVFFDELELPRANYYLDVGSGTHAVQTGKIMAGIEETLVKERPDIVLVQGDTNTVLAGALAAAKLHVRVGHVEAGLRSDDRSMPEEINRVVADHVSDYLFAPTELARKNLVREGIPENQITVTGNTIVDALQQNLRLTEGRPDELEPLGLSPKEYILATAHRQENVDDPVHLAGIIEGLERVRQDFDMPVIYPVHPRAEKMIAEFGMDTAGITMMKPVGFLAFLQLESQARLILTDSGGVQEESCILGVPCVTLRENTERPETIEVGANVLVGTNPHEICEGARMMMEAEPDWQQPFGDGYAGRMIVQVSESVRYNKAACAGVQALEKIQ
jgi:UDP-N-acetylglucosamine 2-epimerase (non-hydrolysing)